jgi:uncharacterized membrane protein
MKIGMFIHIFVKTFLVVSVQVWLVLLMLVTVHHTDNVVLQVIILSTGLSFLIAEALYFISS